MTYLCVFRGAEWCEKMPKRPDDMTEAEVRRCLGDLEKCGLRAATEAQALEPRTARRDKLKELLQGGCGRSFATQVRVLLLVTILCAL